MLRDVWTILRKDWQAELRTQEMAGSLLVFILLIAFLFGLTFPARRDLVYFFPGLVWTAIFFAGMLGLSRSFAGEARSDCMKGLALAPLDRGAVFLGKLASNLLFLVATELVAVPLFFALFDFSPPGHWGTLVAALALGTLGFASVGTLLAAMMAGTKRGEFLLPLALFPLEMPVAVGAVEATAGALGVAGAHAGHWLKLLVAYDLIFLVVPYLLFDYLMEVL
ncbi:MAG: heme exporter protein CcmB [Thermaerobacter sp.]|jgi:heme exporter protein B|nr:heme exporter protein CcmB [Thermaerobacter sp.]MDA8146045.1 heme exporter protein CcmB [Thermaerobacter sp.]